MCNINCPEEIRKIVVCINNCTLGQDYVYSVQCVGVRGKSVFCSAYLGECAVCNMQYVVCNVQSAVCSLQCVMCSMKFAVCSVQSAVCSVQFEVCSVQSAVCSV